MTLCASCERHVYEGEPACPFCGSTAARIDLTPPVRGRLSRAAGHAARAALVASAVACGSSSDRTTDAGPDEPPIDGAVADAGDAQDGAMTDGSARDAEARDKDGAAADAAATDAGEVDADVPTPLYGGVFPDPRKRAVV